MSKSLSCTVAVILSLAVVVFSSVNIDKVTPFAYTISQGNLKRSIEQTVFFETCESECMLNYFWFTSAYSNIGETRVSTHLCYPDCMLTLCVVPLLC
jgi:hypothetical protein